MFEVTAWQIWRRLLSCKLQITNDDGHHDPNKATWTFTPGCILSVGPAKTQVGLLLSSRVTADLLEQILIQAAQKHGRNNHQTICFHPSMQLKHLRASRKQTKDARLRKMWSLQIRNLHRREVRPWKTSQLQTFLGTTSKWKDLRKFFASSYWTTYCGTDHQVSIATRLKYFDKVVGTVACFAAGHRALYKNDLLNMDVSYSKLCRQIVGPPPGTNWSLDWHEILHFWNERVAHFASLAGVKSWSQSVCTHYWKFARYVACLPSHRWVKRVLAWTPPGSRNAGRPANCWEEKLVTYCRYKNFGNWVDAAYVPHDPTPPNPTMVQSKCSVVPEVQ